MVVLYVSVHITAPESPVIVDETPSTHSRITKRYVYMDIKAPCLHTHTHTHTHTPYSALKGVHSFSSLHKRSMLMSSQTPHSVTFHHQITEYSPNISSHSVDSSALDSTISPSDSHRTTRSNGMFSLSIL